MTEVSTEIAVPAPAELGQCLWGIRFTKNGPAFRCQLGSGHALRPAHLFDHLWFDPALTAPEPARARIEWDESAEGAFRADLEELAAKDPDATQVLPAVTDDTAVIDAEIVEQVADDAEEAVQ